MLYEVITEILFIHPSGMAGNMNAYPLAQQTRQNQHGGMMKEPLDFQELLLSKRVNIFQPWLMDH